MLTKIAIRNFKLFDDVELELGERVVFIGPNNAGKTTALQALALWEIGVRRWIEKRGTGKIPKKKRTGVTINRRDLIGVPVPASNLLWRGLHVRKGQRNNGKNRTENILIDIVVDGPGWSCGLEFDYANEESFYCRPLRLEGDERMEVPEQAGNVKIAYLPPMSGMVATETRLDPGAISVRLGEGRTAEVLRNLCYQVMENENDLWKYIVIEMEKLFGCKLEDPRYISERGEITMAYEDSNGTRLDLSASGRGQQQTLLLLTHMVANPGSVLLLDEPDAHLEILRQRQIYQLISDIADQTKSQIIAASHSEVILNEAADKDILIAFIGKPHRIDDRGSQVAKALKEIGFEHYLQAEERGWVLYLEGSTDLSILLALARKLGHPVQEHLESPYVHFVANQPKKAQEHFYGVREAKQDLLGVAVYDHLEQSLPSDPNLKQHMWKRRELENYLCHKEVLLAYAKEEGESEEGPLFAGNWVQVMEETIAEVETALQTLGKPSPWSDEIKVTDDFLDPLFEKFYKKLGLPNLMRKTDYHRLAAYLDAEQIDSEIVQVLDMIHETARQANPLQ
jgi:ABC-type lipoprotein export system ATPase subunit